MSLARLSQVPFAMKSSVGSAQSRGLQGFGLGWKQIAVTLVFSLFLIFVAGCRGVGGGFGGEPIEVSFDPDPLTLNPGETKPVTVRIRRGSDSNNIPFSLRASAAGLSVTPATFVADLTDVAETTQVVQVTAPIGSAGPYTMLIGNSITVAARLPITVAGGGGGTSDFAITATPMDVYVANGGTSGDVQFTVSSVGGFTGTVMITWVVDGGAEPAPNTNNFTGTVSPTTPFTFTRRMFRSSLDGDTVPVVFSATDVPFTKQRSVTVNVHYSP